MFLNIIFTWLVIMIAWNIYEGKKEKEAQEAQRILDILEGKYERNEKGGKPMKQEHFNGRMYW